MEIIGFSSTKSNNNKEYFNNYIGLIKMTQSEKALKRVFNNYKQKSVKKIIKEQRETVLPQEVQKEMPTKQVKKEVKQAVQLDENEKQFIEKYIEYSELTLLNSSADELIATFQKTLGQNASKAIQTLGKKRVQRATKIKELAKELNTLKDQIVKETEKARAKATLISLADSIPAEQPKGKSAKKDLDPEKEMNVINSESKKKKK